MGKHSQVGGGEGTPFTGESGVPVELPLLPKGSEALAVGGEVPRIELCLLTPTSLHTREGMSSGCTLTPSSLWDSLLGESDSQSNLGAYVCGVTGS